MIFWQCTKKYAAIKKQSENEMLLLNNRPLRKIEHFF